MLLDDIIKILEKRGPLKAKELLGELSQDYKYKIDKGELNSFLYKQQDIDFTLFEDFKWELKHQKVRASTSKLKNTFELQGTLVKILAPIEGVHMKRKWKKQDFHLKEAGGKNVFCFTIWNNKISVDQLINGDDIKVSFKMKSKAIKTSFQTYLIAQNIACKSKEIKGVVAV